MKLPLSWIDEYTNISDISNKDYDHAMTMSGSKVEGYEDISKSIKNVRTGKIVKIEKHPDADRLSICQVDINENEPVQIVTAATNMKENDIVPVALHKSTIFGGAKIEKGKLRGVMSYGMFCSVDELGIGEPSVTAKGLLILPSDTNIGEDIVKTLHLDDAIFDFEITSNRPDCLSVIGLARESAATFKRKFTVKKPIVTQSDKPIDDFLKVDVENDVLCRRYTARVITDIKIEESPMWLKRRLISCGVRPINNIVDITNYVMLEYGQPMHAFDISLLKNNHIIVRNAKDNEKITTLDGIERELSSEMLVICDEEKPTAIAGVMGGEFSGINENTKTIVFESAAFYGSSVRKTAQKLGLRTESSSRFEKGLDKEMVVDALDRACELVTVLNCGNVAKGAIDINNNEEKNIKVPFDVDKINKFLGTQIGENEMVDALESLEFEIKNYFVYPPSFRVDIECFNDIAEEVARIYGYDKIPTAPLCGSGFDGGLNREQQMERTIRNTLASIGLFEIYTYSFESPKVFDMLNVKENSPLRDAIKILNPLGADMSIMRTTPLYGMLTSLSSNENKHSSDVKLFEISKTYEKTTDSELPIEDKNITIGAYGDCDFFKLKGIVEETLASIGIKNIDFESYESQESFHPYQTAKILYNNECIGIMGKIHPIVKENFDITSDAYCAILYFTKILAIEVGKPKYKKLNKFPASEKDFSVVVDENITVKQIKDIAKKTAGGILTSIELFDVYRGNQIPTDKKSVSFTFMLENYERTLTDDETNGTLNKIIDALVNEIGASLR